MTTLEEKIPAPRATRLAVQEKRVAQLRDMLKELDGFKRCSIETSNRISAATFEWVQDAVAMGMSMSQKGAVRALANTLRQTYFTVSCWHACGRIIKEYSLPLTARSVYLIRDGIANMGKETLLKAVQAIKDGAANGVVARLVAADRGIQKSRITSRLKRMERENHLTREHLRMELMALLTMARKVFKRDDLMVHVTDTNFAPLCVVGEGRKVATA